MQYVTANNVSQNIFNAAQKIIMQMSISLSASCFYLYAFGYIKDKNIKITINIRVLLYFLWRLTTIKVHEVKHVDWSFTFGIWTTDGSIW